MLAIRGMMGSGNGGSRLLDCSEIIYGSNTNSSVTNINGTSNVSGALGGSASYSAVNPKFGSDAIYIPKLISGYALGATGTDTYNTKTIEMFFNITEPVTPYASLFNGVIATEGNSCVVYVNYNPSGLGYLRANINGTGYNSSFYVTTGVYHHIAVTFEAGATKVYLDGALRINSTNTVSFNTSPGLVKIGGCTGAFGVGSLGGYIDEPLIFNTVRYTGGFTPPESEFTTTC